MSVPVTETVVQSRTNREQLLSAPERKDWKSTTAYKEIFVVPSRKKHDSGWMVMVIVGRKDDGSYEQAAWCDDIGWLFLTTSDYSSMRTDCTYPGGILHFWDATFEVGMSLSSTKVTVKDRQK